MSTSSTPEPTVPASVDVAVGAAAAAAAEVAAAGPCARRAWLESVAEALDEHHAELVAIAQEETRLGLPRLEGELTRNAVNMRYYGAAGERIQSVRGQAQMLDATHDLVRVQLPVGPVAVFGASNFPFQFGTLGHDTCSALAAGCPVVVKAHPAHPGVASRLAEIATEALAAAGAPPGAFGQVEGFEAGLRLVDDPRIAAVGFTGSQRGGMALVERALARPRPIPVYAEMGTLNPVVVTPAGASRVDEIAPGFVDAFTLGTGQFCTKPGLLLVPVGTGLPAATTEVVSGRGGAALLTPGIADAWTQGLRDLQAAGASLLAEGQRPDLPAAATPTLMSVSAGRLREGSPLLEECFGPVALVCEYDDVDQAHELLGRLQPALAAAVWAGGDDDPDLPGLVGLLAGKVGRVVVDGWPTGVATTDAMHHGGPWPATSRPEATSVGAESLARWTRPVAFQNVPAAALAQVLPHRDI